MRSLATVLLTSAFCWIMVCSCTPEEPLITSYNDQWRMLVSGPTGLYTVSMPQGTVQANIWKPASAEAPYPITRIIEFRDQLFALRNASEIVVLDRTDLSVANTISLGAPAGGIAFANATTAYVSLPDLQSVAIVDLTVMRVVGSIDVGSRTSDIAAVGNQICVLLSQTAEAKIIDSRTNAVVATISLPSASPFLVDGDGLSSVFCVVMKGSGKDSVSAEPKTTPMLSSIDVESKQITASVLLTARESQGPEQIPRSLAINSNGFCYVPVQNGLLQIQSRAPRRAAAVQFDAYSGAWYDAARARILCATADGRTIEVFDEYAENKVTTVSIPDSTNCIVGLAP